MFKYLELVAKNEELKKQLRDMTEERDFQEVRANALDNNILEKMRAYREKVGEKEILREKCNLLDNALTRANKVLDEILEVAESNDYNRPSMKVKKIIELAKTRNTTSPIK